MEDSIALAKLLAGICEVEPQALRGAAASVAELSAHLKWEPEEVRKAIWGLALQGRANLLYSDLPRELVGVALR